MVTRTQSKPRSSRVIESLERRRLLAAVPTLVKDVNTLPDTTFEPNSLFSTGSIAYFTQLDVNFGYELWKTDGTPAGTVMLKDINPGGAGSHPSQFTQLGSTVYFSATTDTAGTELWKTDGTAAGTVMVTDAVPGSGSSYPSNLRVAGSQLFFFATTPATGYEVWKSDGSAAGTLLIKDLRPGATGQTQYSSASKTGTVGSYYLYAAFDGTTSGVFRTDGTAAGTSVLINSSSLSVYSIISGGSRAILTPAISITAYYSTDGTPAGTTAFTDTATTKLGVAGNNVFYVSYTTGIGYSLYRKPLTGGTATALTLPSGFSNPYTFLAFGSSAVLTANVASGTALLMVPATGSAVSVLKNIIVGGNAFNPTVINSTLYFLNPGSNELWKTDGTPGGTGAVVTVKDTSSSTDDPVKMVAVGSTLVLENSSTTTGKELWSCNGTAASFAILKDINTSTAFYGAYYVVVGRVGDVLYYQLNDGLSGAELWRTDGTSAGTALVKDINPGTAGSSPTNGVSIGSKLVFSAYNTASGSELWSTDGTAAGTNLVLDIAAGTTTSQIGPPVAMNGVAYFNAYTPASGNELWRSDGTAAGTYLVKDINVGTADAYPNSFVVMNNRLYFVASTPAGNRLWATDGTATGTVLVKDVAIVSANYPRPTLTSANNRLFFAANDAASGTELWMSDGTDAGTALVTDWVGGSASSSPTSFTQIGKNLYFSATTPATGNELFKLNLTTLQESLVTDITAGTADSSLTQFRQLGGTLCFLAANGNANDFYTFDETNGVTRRTDFGATGGLGPSNYNPVVVANGAIFFTADDNLHGIELYEFDGAPSSTVQRIDVYPGVYSSAPQNMLAINGALIFTANTPAYGGELMRLADTAAPLVWHSAFDFNTGPTVRVEWSEAVIAGANTATLISLATGQPVAGVSVVRTIRADGSGVDYSFSSTLPDGNYRLQFSGADFHDAAGNVGSGTQQVDFFVLAGDINRDRKVDFSDLVILAQNYGKTGRTFAQGNLDYDASGTVDFADLVILAQHYNTTLPAAVTITTNNRPTKRRPVDELIEL